MSLLFSFSYFSGVFVIFRQRSGIRVFSTPFRRKEISLLEGYSYRTHFLTPRRYGLRVSVVKNTANGETTVMLVTGNPKRKKRYKEYYKSILQLPSDHQLDILVATLISESGKYRS